MWVRWPGNGACDPSFSVTSGDSGACADSLSGSANTGPDSNARAHGQDHADIPCAEPESAETLR
jgi:hypothetical protein